MFGAVKSPFYMKYTVLYRIPNTSKFEVIDFEESTLIEVRKSILWQQEHRQAFDFKIFQHKGFKQVKITIPNFYKDLK